MSSNDEDPAVTRDQEVMENEEEVGEGSNGDPAATRDQEVKETEEVDVGEGPAEGGEPVAVGGGDGPVEGPAEGGEHVAGDTDRLTAKSEQLFFNMICTTILISSSAASESLEILFLSAPS